ncbi:MAG: hypothetical protein WDZ93_01935 [Candidatus Paceibacterota bacterium]
MSPIRTTTLSRSRRYIIGILVLCIAAAALTYVLFQARFLIEGPMISLSPEPDIIHHERQIMLAGMAKNITAITLNGRSIMTSETGVFNEPIVLENGYTVVRFEARDRFGRTAAIERSFVYVPPPSSVTIAH